MQVLLLRADVSRIKTEFNSNPSQPGRQRKMPEASTNVKKMGAKDKLKRSASNLPNLFKKDKKNDKSLRQEMRTTGSQCDVSSNGLGNPALAKSLTDIAQHVKGLNDALENSEVQEFLDQSRISCGAAAATVNGDATSLVSIVSQDSSVDTAIHQSPGLAELQKQLEDQKAEMAELRSRVKRQDEDVIRVWETRAAQQYSTQSTKQQMEQRGQMNGIVNGIGGRIQSDTEKELLDTCMELQQMATIVEDVATVSNQSTKVQIKDSSFDTIAAAVSKTQESIQRLTQGKAQLENIVKTLEREAKEQQRSMKEQGEWLEQQRRSMQAQQLDLKEQQQQLKVQQLELKEQLELSVKEQQLNQKGQQRLVEIVTLNVASLFVEGGPTIIESTMRRGDKLQILTLCTTTVIKCGTVYLPVIADHILDSVKTTWPGSVWVVVVARGPAVNVHASALPEQLFQARVGELTVTVFSPQLDQGIAGLSPLLDLEETRFESSLFIDELTEMYEEGVWQAVEGSTDDYAIECTHTLFNAYTLGDLFIWNGVGDAEDGKKKRKRRGSTGFMWMQAV